jgi:hypothetical protein
VTLTSLLEKRPRVIRRIYANALTAIVNCPLEAGVERDLTVYTFSSVRHLPEQVASLRSLLRNYGVPKRITVISDGSHGPDDKRLLERVHDRVAVVHHRDIVRDDIPSAVSRYARESPMGVKLGIELSIPVSGPTLYADADVLFYPRIGDISTDVFEDGKEPRYLQDFDSRFLDERLLSEPAEAEHPTNAGVLVLSEPLRWEPALERLDALEGELSFLTEQTVVHLAFRASGGFPLPRNHYILSVDDEDDWRDRYGGSDIALRHYCYSNAIQQKLWLNVGDDLVALARHEPRAAAGAGLAAVRGWRDRRSRARDRAA